MYSNLSVKQKTEHNRIAHKAFTRGLTNMEIKDKTSTRGASTLEDAIETALDMENDSFKFQDMNCIAKPAKPTVTEKLIAEEKLIRKIRF